MSGKIPHPSARKEDGTHDHEHAQRERRILERKMRKLHDRIDALVTAKEGAKNHDIAHVDHIEKDAHTPPVDAVAKKTVAREEDYVQITWLHISVFAVGAFLLATRFTS